MKIRHTKDEFWITNITKRAIHIYDLGTIILPHQSINLLDTAHYSLTREQIENSALSGSLSKKRRAIAIRQFAPDHETPKFIPFDKNAIYPTKHRSVVEPDNTKYEELSVTDEDYAADNSEMAEKDRLGKWNK